MSINDFQLTSMVRRVIVSLGLQTALLDISVINGVAYIKGKIERQDVAVMRIRRDYYYSEELIQEKLSHEYRSTLEALDRQIRIMPGIRGAVYKLKGWERRIGKGWVRIHGES
ncbi:hypothetical protein JXR74_02640 [Candidatus Mcinerneyibacteriota bacterium]|nr:hypothetical protein [Candidatus Mcinerneyibacteriota bacterium]